MTSLGVRQGNQNGCTGTSATSPCVATFNSKANMRKTVDEYTHNIRPVHTVRLERFWTTR